MVTPLRTTWGLPVLIIITLLVTLALNPVQTATQHHANIPSSYRTPAWLQQHLTLGYSKALAVVYWFDVIGNFGGKLADEADYSLLAEKLNTITTLDPHAGHAYYTAATTLTWQLHSTTLSGPLLERGVTMMPDEWRWPYYRGFYSSFFDHDSKTAAKYLTIATKHPDVPPILMRLAAKMHTQQSGLDTGLLFLQQMLKRRQDPAIQENLRREITKIKTEKVLRSLDKTIKNLPHWQGTVLHLQQLGIQLPKQLPDGGTIILDEHHRPISSKAKRRYKLFQSAAYKRMNP